MSMVESSKSNSTSIYLFERLKKIDMHSIYVAIFYYNIFGGYCVVVINVLFLII